VYKSQAPDFAFLNAFWLTGNTFFAGGRLTASCPSRHMGGAPHLLNIPSRSTPPLASHLISPAGATPIGKPTGAALGLVASDYGSEDHEPQVQIHSACKSLVMSTAAAIGH